MSKKSSCVICRVAAYVVYFIMSIVLGGAADCVIDRALKPQETSENEEVRKKAVKKRFVMTIFASIGVSASLMWLWKKADKEIIEYYK